MGRKKRDSSSPEPSAMEMLTKLVAENTNVMSKMHESLMFGMRELKESISHVRLSAVQTENINSVQGANGTATECVKEERYIINDLQRNYQSSIVSFKELGGNNLIFRPDGNLHPVAFIEKLTELFETSGMPSDRRVPLAIAALRGSASNWGEIKRDEFSNYEHFKTAFFARYWDVENERKLFRKLRYGVFSGGSHSDYFLQLVKESKYLREKISEVELIEMVASHFPYEIQRGVVSSGIRSVDEMDEFLRRIDRTEGARDRQQGNYEGRWRHPNNNGDRNARGGRVANDGGENASNSNNRGAIRRETNSNQVSEVNTVFNVAGDDLLEEPVEELSVLKKPVVNVEIEELMSSKALIDSGSQLSCMSKEFVDKLRVLKPDLASMPVLNVTVVGALKGKGQTVKESVCVSLQIQDIIFDYVFVVVPSLVRDIILGCDWLTDYNILLDFSNEKILGDMEGKAIEFSFRQEICDGVGVQVSEIRIENEGVENIKGERSRALKCQYSKEELNMVAQNAEMFNDEGKAKLNELLNEFQDIFSDEPGLIKCYSHEILLRDYTPFYLKSYPIPDAYKDDVHDQIQEMLVWGVIEKRQTEFVSPLVVVRKKDGSPRICLDSRFINQRMVKDHVVPPNPSEFLFKFSRGQYLTTIDLSASYWQVPIRSEHQKYTGFSYNNQTFVFKRLPFGYCTAIGSFIRALNVVLGDDVNDFVIPYVDDLLIFSDDCESHLSHLRIIFEKFRRAGVTIKLKKSLFARREVHFLGHIISSSGVRMEPERVASIVKFKSPRNLKQVRSFLGLINYDRRFMESFSALTLPLVRLLKKGITYKWGVEEEQAFNEIKLAFTKVMELKHPDPNRPYYIKADASAYGVGACLCQKCENSDGWNVIGYFSRILKKAEVKYSVSEKEALAIVCALKQWRVFILGREVTILTDHKALSFLTSCKLLNGRLTRWALYIQEFGLKIEYVKGKENTIADILSRNPVGYEPESANEHKDRCVEICVAKVSSLGKIVKSNFKTIKVDQEEDEFCTRVRRELNKKDGMRKYKEWFVDHKGLLFKRGTGVNEGYKLVVPRKHVIVLIQQEHEDNGHFGVSKCQLALSRYYYWRKFKASIRKVVASCDLCQKSKSTARCHGEMQSVCVEGPNVLVCIDLMGPLPVSRGGVTQLFVVIDAFSKYVRLFPLRRATTASVLKCLQEKYFPEVGKPKKLLADNGTQFTARKFNEILLREGVKLLHTTSYYPQGNMTERINKEIGRLIRAICFAQHSKWACVIPDVQMWLNRVIHDSTGYSPQHLHFGKPIPNQFLQNIDFPVCEAAEQDIVVLARRRLQTKAEKRKERYFPSKPTVFHKGDKVLLRTHQLSSAENKEIKKFFLLYKGPYTVESMVYPNVYSLIDEKTGEKLGNHNVYNLKPYVEPFSEN